MQTIGGGKATVPRDPPVFLPPFEFCLDFKQIVVDVANCSDFLFEKRKGLALGFLSLLERRFTKEKALNLVKREQENNSKCR